MEAPKIGDTYKNGKVISAGIMPARMAGANGRAKLPVKEAYIGRPWVVVQYSDGSTRKHIIGRNDAV